MTTAMWEQLGAFVEELARERDVRAVVIAGMPDAFAAGADIAEFRSFTSAQEGLAYEASVEAVFDAIESLPLPVVAAVSGACTGGGALLACACDLRLGAANARVGIPVARTLGNVTTAKNVARLAAAIGLGRTREWFVGARLHDAESAWRAGFFTELASSYDALLERAQSLAEELATFAPLTIGATKSIARGLLAAQTATLDDRELLTRCYGSDDFREGIAAFVGGRRAHFLGK